MNILPSNFVMENISEFFVIAPLLKFRTLAKSLIIKHFKTLRLHNGILFKFKYVTTYIYIYK